MSEWKWPGVKRWWPRWRYMSPVDLEEPEVDGRDPHVVRVSDFVAKADRVAELEAELAQVQSQLEQEVECYGAAVAEGKRADERVSELEGYLQQAKDDYELALRENEKLRAGLEKVENTRAICALHGWTRAVYLLDEAIKTSKE